MNKVLVERSRQMGKTYENTFTRMPYTTAELERACDYLAPGTNSFLPLWWRAAHAADVGIREGKSLYSPSMRVVLQACKNHPMYV